jgi:hypothetical protein
MSGPSGLFSNTFGPEEGGRMTISAPRLQMDGGRIQVGAAPGSRGNVGSIEVWVGQLTLTGGAQLSTSSFGAGRGGEVTVVASESIAITGSDREGTPSGLFSSSQGSGSGGRIRVQAGHLELRDGGTISARSSGGGDAGTIQLQVGETFQGDRGLVTATAAADQGAGGNIQLTAGSLVQLIDSELTATSRGGQEGNITLDSPLLVLAGSRIVANAFAGLGGNVAIRAGVFLADPASLVEASSILDITGAVNALTWSVAPLPQTFMSVAALEISAHT